MSRIEKQNSYRPGDVVYAKKNPAESLVIRRYYKQIYYCKIQDKPENKELVYFERELVEDKELIAKNVNLPRIHS